MDAYQKLRPWTEIEACRCGSVAGLFLVDLLTDNPIHCSDCRREVDPARVQLTVEETELVAHWYSAASALYRLWLNSGEYEDYAKARLIDPEGQVNREGLHVARCYRAESRLDSGSLVTRMMASPRGVRSVARRLIRT